MVDLKTNSKWISETLDRAGRLVKDFYDDEKNTQKVGIYQEL